MKTKEEIRATTKPIPRPADYKYGEKLKEWDATLTPGAEDSLWRIKALLNDRIVVKLLAEQCPICGSSSREVRNPRKWTDPGAGLHCTCTWHNAVVLTDERPLIGGMRKAIVLAMGPGKLLKSGKRRPIPLHLGQIVYIGNWVDLEGNGLALCQEGDVRVCLN